MKNKQVNLSTAISFASLIMTVASMIWIGGFRLSGLIHDVDGLKEDVKEIKARVEKIETEVRDIKYDLYKMDHRVTTLENRKP